MRKLNLRARTSVIRAGRRSGAGTACDGGKTVRRRGVGAGATLAGGVVAEARGGGDEPMDPMIVAAMRMTPSQDQRVRHNTNTGTTLSPGHHETKLPLPVTTPSGRSLGASAIGKSTIEALCVLIRRDGNGR